MNIQGTLPYIATFTELENVVKGATEGITLFGYRYIKVRGYKGSLHIDDLAIKLIYMSSQKFECNDAEKGAAERLSKLVDRLYRANDARCHCFVRIRDEWNITKNIHNFGNDVICPKFYWCEYQEKLFYKYLNNREINDGSRTTNYTDRHLPFEHRPLCHVISCFSNQSIMDVIVERAEEGISFFGYRYIKVKGYSGTVPIDALAAKVMDMVKPRFDFDEGQRAVYKRMAERITHLYKANDKRCVNCFTLFFCAIRDLWKYLTTPRSMNHRFQWFQQKECEVFEYYTPEQYDKAFHAHIPQGSLEKTRRVGFRAISVYRPVQAVVS